MKTDVFYGQHLVCFMDLLGQKDMYKAIERFPFDPVNKNKEFHNLLVRFIRMIKFFKSDIDSFFGGLEEYESILPWPDSEKELRDKANKNICKIQRFSDGIVVFVPLKEIDHAYPISSVFNALGCTASTVLTSLARGTPIRVGIAIGGGAEIDDGELFGPVMANAYETESKLAIFPRIAIHQSIIEYLDSHLHLENSPKEDIQSQIIFQISKLCRSMISVDFDNQLILDYLGNAMWKSIFKGGDSELLNAAFKFVETEKQRFITDKNEKLIHKYEYLHNYFLHQRPEILAS